MAAKPGRHGDGGGVYLVVQPSCSKKWVFRFSFAGKVTEMGLGSGLLVSLAEAREKAQDARRLVAAGINPIERKKVTKSDLATQPTFGIIADQYFDSKSSSWRNKKHHEQWRVSLEKTAAPIRSIPGR